MLILKYILVGDWVGLGWGWVRCHGMGEGFEGCNWLIIINFYFNSIQFLHMGVYSSIIVVYRNIVSIYMYFFTMIPS